jgi:hypothetical protein
MFLVFVIRNVAVDGPLTFPTEARFDASSAAVGLASAAAAWPTSTATKGMLQAPMVVSAMSGRWLCLFCVTKPSHSYMMSAKECFTMKAVAEARAPPAFTS